MIKKLATNDWAMTALFGLSGSSLSILAWRGNKVALMTLGGCSLAILILHRVTSHILARALNEMKDFHEHWRVDAEYGNHLTALCTDMLEELVEHDREKTMAFAARLRDVWAEQYIGHYPNIGEEILRRADEAKKN